MHDTERFDIAAGLLRVSMGVMFIAHALLKVVVFTMPGTVAYFESLGLPGVLAYATVAAELAGGAMLVVGAWTRLVSLALLPILLGAAWAHAGNGWVFSAPDGGWEYPAHLALLSVVLALQGGGRYSLDTLLAGRRSRPAVVAGAA